MSSEKEKQTYLKISLSITVGVTTPGANGGMQSEVKSLENDGKADMGTKEEDNCMHYK